MVSELPAVKKTLREKAPILDACEPVAFSAQTGMGREALVDD